MRSEDVANIVPRFLSGGKVLDVGAGRGMLAHRLQELGYEVEAIDIDPTWCVKPDVSVRQCDVMQGLPYPDSAFDGLTATELIEHMEDPFKAIREFNRVLKPGGVLFVTTPNYGQIESRLRYFFTGCLPNPLPVRLEAPAEGKSHLHISPMTVMRLRYLLLTGGFEPVFVSTCLPRTKSWPLAPLASLWWLFVHVFWSRKRRRKYNVADQCKVILGGRTLVIVSRKKISAEVPPFSPATAGFEHEDENE